VTVKKKFTIYLIAGLFSLGCFSRAFAATEFTAVVDTGNGADTDYTSLASWETGVQTDLTAGTTQVFSGARTAAIADNATVYLCRGGAYQSHSGTVVHATAGQILVDAITGSATETSGDVWYTNNTCNSANYFTVTDGGNSAIAVAKCRTSNGSADTNAIGVDGWITSATNYIKIWTDPSENYRHSGVWDEGRFRVGDVISVNEDFVKIQGLQLLGKSAGNPSIIMDVDIADGGLVQIGDNIFKGNFVSGDYPYGIMLRWSASGTKNSKIWNNIFYDFNVGTNPTAIFSNGNYNSYIYNNTFYNCYRGINSANGPSIVKNNLAYNNVIGYDGWIDSSSTNNLSGPTQTDAPGLNPRNAQIVHFADEANNDFHLDSADTGAKNQGIKLYNSSDDANLNFTTDIDGDTRLDSAGTWDIGADENVAKIYRSVAPSATGALATGGASNYGNLEIKPTYLSDSTTRITDYVATFWRPLPDNVGVGDAVQYDADDNGSIDHVVFITKRWDSAHFSVRTASGGAPTSTISPDADFGVFRSYISLFNAEAGTENTGLSDTIENYDTWSDGKDLTTNNEQWNVACYAGQGGMPDADAFTIHGWGTASHNYLKIYTPTNADEVGTTQRQNGKWDESKFYLETAEDSNDAIGLDSDYVRIDGLQIFHRGLYDDIWINNLTEDENEIQISNCIIRGDMDNHYGVNLDSAGMRAKIWNTLIYSNLAGVFVAGGDGKNLWGYNISTINNDYGFMNYSGATGSYVLKNCLAANIYEDFTDPFIMSNSASADSTADNFGGIGNRGDQVFSFVDLDNDDFHLAPSDTGARNFGADLSNDLDLPIGTDIDSTGYDAQTRQCLVSTGDDCNTRPRGTLFDIGADEVITKIYRSVAPGAISAIDTGSSSHTVTIAGIMATFSSAVPDNIGVGDVVQYNISGTYYVAFISGRIDATRYTVNSASGGIPTAVSASQAWYIYRAYTSLSNAEAGIENTGLNDTVENFDSWANGKDIAASSEQWNIACYANGTTADTTRVDINDWTTGKQNFIKIYTPYLSTEVGISQRHQGKWDDNKYRLEVTSQDMNLWIWDNYVRVDGLQITNVYATYAMATMIFGQSGAGEINVSNNIYKGHNNTNGEMGISGNAMPASVIVKVWNNLFYDFDTTNLGGSFVLTLASSGYAYNNTVIGGAFAIYASTAVLKNNIVQNSPYAYYNSTNVTESTNNLSGLGTSYGAPGKNPKLDTTVSFVDATNKDFHLLPSDTGARGFGKDLSKDQNLPVTKDIDGQNFKFPILNFETNPNDQISNADIGADQAAMPIYRSLSPSATGALDTGSADANSLSISGTTMTVVNATPDNIGVGDVVQYDSDGNDSIDAIAFITGRTSSSQYSVQNREGGVPVPVINDQNWSIFRAHTALSDAEAGTENTEIADGVEHFDIDRSITGGKDIYASNQQYNLAAYGNGGTADTSSVSIDGWNTYPTDYIKIYTPNLSTEVGISQRHQGKWDEGRYRMERTGTGVISIVSRHVRIDGIQVKHTSSGDFYANTIYSTINSIDSNLVISNNIFQGVFSGIIGNSSASGFNQPYGSLVNEKFVNNIYYGYLSLNALRTSAAIFIDGSNAYLYNNTISGSERGIIRGTGRVIAKNNLSYNNTTDYSGTFDSSSTNNLSKDATAPALGAYYRNATVQFADETNKDFHLAANDTSARNMGANLSGDAFNASLQDIDGHTRNVASHSGAWDIGADEGATAVYYSVGQNTNDHRTGEPNISISNGIATFTIPQTATNMGVGDKIVYNGFLNEAYITQKISTSEWRVVTATGTVAPDRTTTSVQSISHPFSSIEGAVDGNTATGAFDATHLNTEDLYANNYQLNIPCYYDTGADSGIGTEVNGFVTAIPNYIRIYTPTNTMTEANQSQRHLGKWTSTAFAMKAAYGHGIRFSVPNTKFDGIQIDKSDDGYVGIISYENFSEISNNIIRNFSVGMTLGGSRRVYNNIIYGAEDAVNSQNCPDCTFYNNTLVNNGVGIRLNWMNNPSQVSNNIFLGNTTDFVNEGGTIPSFTYNTTNQSSGIPAGTGNRYSQTFSFQDSANADYHLSSADTAAKSFGTNLAADPYFAFASDIDGGSRPGASSADAWDIGADQTPVEFVSVVDTGNGADTDYTSLASWETGVQTDLTVGTTQVFSGARTQAIADNATVYLCRGGAYQTHSGTVVHATAGQILVDAITGSATETSGDVWYTNNTCNSANYFTISNGGDSAIAVAKCRASTGSADTSAVTVDGWSTSASNYIKIWTDPEEHYRHGGVWDEGKYQLSATNPSEDLVLVNEDFIKIDGLQFNIVTSETYGDALYLASGDGGSVEISNNIIKGTLGSGANYNWGVVFGWNASGMRTGKFWNNIVYGFSTSGGINANGTWMEYVYNNTITNCDQGILDSAGNVIAKNNIVYNNTDNYVNSFNASSTNNLSGPDQSDAPGTNPRNAQVVHFADEANNDFHLDSADTGAKNQGIKLYNSSDDANLNFTTDIDGDTRLDSAGTWDIGADENVAKIYRSVGPSATTALAVGGSSNYGNLEIKPTYLPDSTTRITDYVATFWRPLPENVGVGDAVQYDADDNGSIDHVVFITKRWDSAHFSVRTSTGASPVATIAPDADFGVYRAYTSLNNATDYTNGGTENSGIAAAVSNFDAWSGGKDLTAGNEQWNVACYANGTTADTVGGLINDNWTTAPNNYLKIYTPTNSDEVGVSQRHQGKWDVNKYRLDVVSGESIRTAVKNIRYEGLQVRSENGGAIEIAYSTTTDKTLYVVDNILDSYMTGVGENSSLYGTAYIYNNIIYGMTQSWSYGINIPGSSSYAFVYNNTIFASAPDIMGIVGTSRVTAKNNLVKTTSSSFWSTFNSNSDYNSSGGTTTTGGAHDKISQTFSFVDEANKDFHLAPSDTGARNFGADLSNDLDLPLNTDIDSTGYDVQTRQCLVSTGDDCNTRPRGTLFDIGADEVITKIYRSVAPDNDTDNNLSAIATGEANSLTVSATTSLATFTNELPDNIGVGDVLQYDSNNNGSIGAGDTLAFITGRTDSRNFTVKTASGTAPVARSGDTYWSIFRAYTSLSNAEAGTENTAIDSNLRNFDSWSGGKDIAASSEQWNIAAYANGTASDTVAVTIDGWNTAPQNFIKVYAPYLVSEVGISQRHQGKWDDGKYRINPPINSSAIFIRENYTKIDGLQIFVSQAPVSQYAYGFWITDGGGTNIRNCIIRGPNTASTLYHSASRITSSVAIDNYFSNNIIYDFTGDYGYGIALSSSTARWRISNTTLYNCTIGYWNDGGVAANMYLKNTLSQNCVNGNYGSFNIASDYNLSNLATDAPGPHSKNSTTVQFVDATNKDFHLSPADTGARGFGKDLSKDQNLPVTKDIDGQNIKFPILNFETNPNDQISNVDIGADQAAVPIYRSLAPSATGALDTGSADANNLSISGTTMTVVNATPDNIGVGDVVQYDSDGNDSIDAIAFITGRTSSTIYSVQDRTGASPVPTSSADQNWSIFRAHTSLSNAEAGTENSGVADNLEHFDVDRSISGGKDIYASNQQYNLAAYGNGGTADTAQAWINGWTTYPTNYIKAYTPILSSEVGVSQRHQGKWDDGKYRLEFTAPVDHSAVIVLYDGNVRIDGLQVRGIWNNRTGGYAILSQPDDGTTIDISNNIISASISGTSSGQDGVRITYFSTPGTRVAKIWSNVIYNFSGSGLNVTHTGWGTGYGYNNTLYGNNVGINSQGDSVIKNNISYNNTDNYANAFSASSTNNLSGPTQTDAPGLNPQNAKVITFADETNKDFHLASTDTSARNMGADLSADANLAITNDIDGHTRSTSSHTGAFDIGADEGATAVYYSVGQNITDHMTGSPTVTIASGTATFDVAQTATNMGIGDKVTYNSTDVAYITGKTTTSIWTVRTATGTIPANITDSPVVSIAHVFSRIYDTYDATGAGYLNTYDLATNNYQVNFPCYYDSGSDTTSANIGQWITSLSNFIKYYTPTDINTEANSRQRHWGKWDDTKFNMKITNDWGYGFDMRNAGNIVIDGIQIDVTANNGSGRFRGILAWPQHDGGAKISNNIIRGNISNGSEAAGIDTDGGSYGCNIIVYNNIIYGFNVANSFGIVLYSSYVYPTYVLNNTIYNNSYGISLGNGLNVIKNNIVYNNNDNYYEPYFDASSTNNLSGPTQTDAPGTNPQNAKTVTFVDSANADFHLASTDTAAKNFGADLSADSNFAFTKDIDGNTRNINGRGWDIGADEAATAVYYSVGQDGTTDRKVTGTVSINSAGLATFSAPQTGNIGVGDVIDYDSDNKKAYIVSKIDQSNWNVQTNTGALPAIVTDATVNSIKRVFSSLSSAEAGATGATLLNTSDLLTNNYQLNFPCYYDTGADTTAVTVNGYTTAPTNFIKIYTPYNTTSEANTSQRHSGKWDDSKFRMEVSGRPIDAYANVSIDGVQAVATNDWAIAIQNTSSGQANISNNIIKNSGTGIVNNYGSNTGVNIWNNIIYNCNEGIYTYQERASYIYNNTVYGCSVMGFYTNGVNGLTYKNNISYNNAINFNLNGYNASSTNNLSGPTQTDAPGSNPQNAKVVNFADVANKDFHLSATDTSANSMGADLSVDTNLPFTTDIDGGTRTTPWDIGADEGAIGIYYSVGQNTNDHKTGTNPTVSIASGVATFSEAQTATNLGVGDKVTYNNTDVAYITAKTSTSVWRVATATGTTPADITDSAVVSITHAFASLEGAVDADTASGAFDATHLNTKDLTSGNYQLNIPCYYDSGADTTAVAVEGWTTAANNYIKIYTPNNTATEVNLSQRHQGKWDDGKYSLVSNTSGWWSTMTITNEFVRVDGLQIKRVSAGNSNPEIVYINANNANSDIQLSNNLAVADFTGLTSYGYGIGVPYSSNNRGKIWNNIIYSVQSGSVGAIALALAETDGFVRDFQVYNNSIIGWTFGVGGSDYSTQIKLKNNISYNNVDNYSGNFDASSTNNLSGPTQNDAPGLNPQNTKVITFADEPNKDFHLASTDTSARNMGADLSADANLAITNDIDGHTRSTSSHTGAFDIGADEGATAVYYSVGQNTTDHKTGAPTVTIASGTATFNVAQTATNMGVGDKITYNSTDVAYITGKTTTSIWTVRTATGTIPADITDSPVVSIAHPFASLEGAVDANTGAGAFDSSHLNSKDLAGNNYQLNIPCYYDSGADTIGVTVGGWNTSVPNYIRIYTPFNTTTAVNQSQRHDGRWKNSAFTIGTTAGEVVGVYSISQVKIDGLQIDGTNGAHMGIWTSGNDTEISNNIVRNIDTGLYLSASRTHVANNIIYGNDTAVYFQNGDNIYLSNNTIVNSAVGFEKQCADGYVKNNILSGNTSDYSNTGCGGDPSFTYNSTNQASGIPAGTGNRYSQTFSFLDSANADYHLAQTDSAAKNFGADLSADSNFAFNTDIDGNTRLRPGSGVATWDIGADEAATAVYYSVGQDGTTDRKVAGNISINSAGLATFSAPQTGNIGVGDVIDYDSDAKKAYIVSKTDQSNWNVQTNTGALPATVTNVTVNSIKRVFSSLSSAEAGATGATLLNTSDLLTNNYQLNFPCYYDTGADTAGTTISGYATAPTNFINIYTPNNTTTEANSSQRHLGKWDDAKYRMQITNTDGINARDGYVKVDGLQIDFTNSNGGYQSGIYTAAYGYPNSWYEISNNIVRGTITGDSASAGILADVYSNNTAKIWNNIVYDFTNSTNNTRGIWIWNATAYVYNNTVYHNSYGIVGGGMGPIAKNNISYNNRINWYSGFYATSTNNLSGPTQTDAPGTNPQNGKSVVFVDETNKDFHLTSTDVNARNAGVDLSADTNLKITSDIDGQNRLTGAGMVDIGADETATEVFYSVGQNTTDHKTGTAPTVSIASGVATFSEAQTATNMGVGDKVIYNTNVVAYITGKTTTSIWTVRTATGTLPADITDSAVVSVSHAFGSLYSALGMSWAGAADSNHLNTGDLVTGNYTLNTPCYYDSGPEVYGVNLLAFTTSPENFVRVYTPTNTSTEANSSQRHDGKWEANKYYDTSVIAIYNNYVKIDGLQFSMISSSSADNVLGISGSISGPNKMEISNSIISGVYSSGGWGQAIYAGASSNVYVSNNLIYGFSDGSAYSNGVYSYGNLYAYNNTIANCSNGISIISGGMAIAKNNIVYGSGDTNAYGGTFASGTDYNATDGTDDIGQGTHNKISQSFSFVDATNNDFHLANNDTGAKNMGIFLGNDPYLPFMTDIDGQSRPSDQTKWDIGADENENALIEFKQNVELKSGVEFKIP
jgi:hypothetical protein